jgi:formamidopyrimidine-DNA glycosylase
MPELPEVENVVRTLSRDLQGARLERVRKCRRDMVHGDPRPPEKLLRGKRVVAVKRLGKRIEIELSGRTRLFVHLGMTGQLRVVPRAEPPAPHTHLCVDLAVGGRADQLRFRDVRRFGGIWLFDGRPEVEGKPLPAAGLDILAVRLGRFREVMRRSRQIKALLLDQRILAGMGNIYCDEVLFRCGIHPLRQARSLSDREVRKLYACIRRVLRAAIRAGGSTVRSYRGARNEAGGYQRRHQVYGRGGKPCLRCGTRLLKIAAAGRGTVVCPHCQPKPT